MEPVVPLVVALVLLGIFVGPRSVVTRISLEGITHRNLLVERSLLWQDIAKVSTVAEMAGSKARYHTIGRQHQHQVALKA